MPKKNGFIAISILYSFLLCFVMLMAGMLANYMSSRLLLNKLNSPLEYEQDNKLSTILIKKNEIKYPGFNGIILNNLEGEPPLSGSDNSGLYTYYNEGATNYYFRGNINNNYINFAGLTWRIVRINGDKSIKIILNDDIGTTSYFRSPYSSSSLKTTLENWYNSHLNSYSAKIATSNFCTDVSGDAYNRINIGNPQLICSYSNTNSLKIGLLTVDELMMAGLSTSSVKDTNFLYHNKRWLTFSKKDSSTLYYGNGNRIEQTSETSAYIYPVINLNSNTLVKSGDGQIDSPYVIE